ncbi:hypothetical protein KFE25_001050 [Diacronema lutheri]|uniref:ADP,ATP carrier protein n=2 Tax=Diacronema lutheri TaxID=2081491 RepID=A0A8J5X9N8_DIALT|nr:hypothetical protein KFE25_001050 [Diacronema lutheri]
MEGEAEDAPGVFELSPPEPLAWKKAFAGASSGVVCCAVFSPLDVVRTRLQVQGALGNASLPVYSGIVSTLARIQREEGFAGWFRGFAPAILTVPVFWSLYFPLYDRMKPAVAHVLRTDTRSSGVHMFSAVSAGFAINVLTNPLWVVRTRLQTQALHGERGRGMVQVCRDIFAAEGWRSFYRGLGASMLGLSHIAIQFPVYESAKSSLGAIAKRRGEGNRSPSGEGRGGNATSALGKPPVRGGGGGGGDSRSSVGGAGEAAPQQHPTWVVLAASFISKLLASSATYPHELVRARLQDQRFTAGQGRHYRGIVDAVQQTVRNEGVSALWHGFSVNLVRAVPQSMITFGLYEWLIWAM